jgi:parallel beta-helix repeat protein
VPLWIGSTFRAQGVGILAACVLVLAMLLPVGIPAPATVHAADPSAAVWSVAPGDAAHIQEAINAARDAGGGAVYLPGAIYFLTAKVRVHSNVTVFGDGIDRTVLRWTPGVAADHMMSNGSLTDGNTNIQIWNLTLDGQETPSGRTDCCFGLRLNNVHDSYIVNVAAVGHSKDGIYLGHGGAGGVVNVRVSGCQASGNGRNGISLVEGDSIVIDHCRVEYNNLIEKIAGIDVEPDEGLSVTNSKLVGNTVFSQDVGIRLYVPYGGYAAVSDNAVCQNRVSGHRGPGVFDHKTVRTMYVDNALQGNRKDFQVGADVLTGSRYAGACQLPALPAVPMPASSQGGVQLTRNLRRRPGQSPCSSASNVSLMSRSNRTN